MIYTKNKYLYAYVHSGRYKGRYGKVIRTFIRKRNLYICIDKCNKKLRYVWGELAVRFHQKKKVSIGKIESGIHCSNVRKLSKEEFIYLLQCIKKMYHVQIQKDAKLKKKDLIKKKLTLPHQTKNILKHKVSKPIRSKKTNYIKINKMQLKAWLLKYKNDRLHKIKRLKTSSKEKKMLIPIKVNDKDKKI